MEVEAALDAAAKWLSPLLQKDVMISLRGKSIIERLHPDDSESPPIARRLVVSEALNKLKNINDCFGSPSDGLSQSEELIYQPKNRRSLYMLIDLISLEGIYPCLSTGVGVPIERRVKSALPVGVIASRAASNTRDQELLCQVVGFFANLFRNTGKTLLAIYYDRILVDVIAAAADICYSPETDLPENQRADYLTLLQSLLEQTPTSVLLPTLTSLLHPGVPDWLRPQFSVPLSYLPLRPLGVRQTIEFIASATPNAAPPISPQEMNKTSSSNQGPLLPLEALSQASRLLSSVPASLTPEDYFSRLAPQIFGLLDGEAGPEMTRAAGFIIASGILGSRLYGAPGKVGWVTFVNPILSIVNPVGPNTPSRSIDGPLDLTIVAEDDLERALSRLSAIIFSYPNPGVAKRLLGSLLLPLWALACFAEQTKREAWYNRAFLLLQTFLKLSSGIEKVVDLSRNLLSDGRPPGKINGGWIFAPGDMGGVRICRRTQPGANIKNYIEKMEDIDRRVATFIKLIQAGIPSESDRADLFLRITKRWLLTPQPSQQAAEVLIGGTVDDEGDPLQKLVDAKLVQKLLEELKDVLAKSPVRVLELVRELLALFVEKHKDQEKRVDGLHNPSIASLQHIVSGNNSSQTALDSTEDEPTEIVSVALSLLSTILTSFDLHTSDEEKTVLSIIKPSLVYLTTAEGLPSMLSITASNLVALLNVLISDAGPSSADTKKEGPLVEDHRTYSLSLTYLMDSIPPVRAQGLTMLIGLIDKSSPVIDVPSISTTLISLLNDSDEFIFLNAIKALTALAKKHSRTTTRLILERYLDESEEMSLDQRLKLGEALQRVVQQLGEAFAGDAAKEVGEGCLALAGRRGEKPKKEAERKQRQILQTTRHREADEAWGGELPQLDGEASEDNDKERNEILAQIVEGWEGKGKEEDVRIRTSGLAIFGSAVETNIAGLGASLVSAGVDLTISILTLETSKEKGILRRAAVLLIMSLVRALDRAREEGRVLGFGFAGENLEEVVRVLRYVQGTDGDGLVRGHVGKVLEALDVWRVKSVMGSSGPVLGAGGIGQGEGLVGLPSGVGLEKGGRLAGLSVGAVGAEDASGSSRPRPRIEEVE